MCWFVAIVELLDVGDLERATEDVWDRLAFITRYGNATLTEAMVDLDRSDQMDYIAAIGRLLKAENAKRDS